MKFEDPSQQVILGARDLNGANLETADLSKVPTKILETSDFDSKTKWPQRTQLPENFDPIELLERGKDPGLGLRKLHAHGITGKGVHVAIIDQNIPFPHEEFSDQITYQELSPVDEPASMHGPAVASLLVGKNCGVAPGASLHYFGTPSGRNFTQYANVLNHILEQNKTVPPTEKIRIVSCSIGFNPTKPEPGLDGWIEILAKAKTEGVIIVDTADTLELPFVGGGASRDKDNMDSYEPWLSLKDAPAHTIERTREALVVPSDYRTMASQKGTDSYLYTGKGGMSWAAPYLAGVLALGLQINPEATRTELTEILKKTAKKNKNSLTMIDPAGFVEALKK